MDGQSTVRIAPKRLRLFGIFSGSIAVLFLAVPMVIGITHAIALGPGLYLVFLVLLLISGVVTVLSFLVFALWALARLVLNLPAVVLTPTGIVNHSIVYHVLVPWDEVDQFTRMRFGKGRDSVNMILVHEKDEHRLYAMQQPLTKLLMRVFHSLRPPNINTRMTAGTQEQVWEQLQRYVRKHVPDRHITFDSIT